MMRGIQTLARRELVRFFRQGHRVVGSVAQPVLFWVLLGSGFSASFQAPGYPGLSYTEYFFPGILLMVVLFSGIFSTITVIEDRAQGLLQGVLVSPIPRMAIVLGKVIGAMVIGLLQALFFMLALPFLGLSPDLAGLVFLLFGLTISALGFTALGFLIAWNMESTAGFHAIMSVFLMPLWMLSGALFPMENAPIWLESIMFFNPVSHALLLIRLPLYHPGAELLGNGDYLFALAVATSWAVIMLGLALGQVNRQQRSAKPTLQPD
ncbi:MAG: ABC transporter permease [Magnetococcales bacterium]|nr:ABC transporter permease [Magnetococcales bacterium]